MPIARRPGKLGIVILMGTMLAAMKATPSSSFEDDMSAAMSRMHHSMSLPSSGDPDVDFAAMMIPHHEGAIAMARAELAHGSDPQLRRLASGMIVEQSQEIVLLQRFLDHRQKRAAQ